jgi:FAD/FMN-containing dehydrogenase
VTIAATSGLSARRTRGAAYPGPTWDRLRELKRRYHPDNLFRLNHNIPPADPSTGS